MNDISDINLDYKALYEQAKAKLDAIELEKTKKEVEIKLAICRHLTNDYNQNNRREEIKKQEYFTFLRNLYADENVEAVIKEIGWEKLTKIIDDIYKEILEEENTKVDEI